MRVRLTPEYGAGILSGIGVGFNLLGYLMFGREMWVEMGEYALLGFALIGAGAGIAYFHQHRMRTTHHQDAS